MDKEFVAWLEGLGFTDESSFTDTQLANLKNKFKAELAATPQDSFSTSVEEIANNARAKKQHASKIAAITQAAMDDHPMFTDQIEKLAKAALDSHTDPDKFELELIRATRSKKGQFTSHMTGTPSDPKVIEAALSMASGLPDIEKHYRPEILDQVDRAGLRNVSLQQLLMQTAHANGYTCRAGERIHGGNIRAVLEYCFPPVHARLQGWSTVTLPNILGAVANKQILAGYTEEDSTWREFASIKSASNFHQQNHYRMLDSLEYEEVGSGGAIPHGTLGEETYTSQVKTYGKMLGLTRTQIINDDLSAFDDIRNRLGRGASKKFNNVFWAAFMNNASFFTTALTNYIDGATTNLGTDGVGLGLGVKAFRKMTSPSADGTKRVGVGSRPTKLLVPPELEFIADQLFVGGSPDAQTVANTNVFRGKYRPFVQNRLSDSAFTGNSTTAWYLFGDELKPMVVSFLNGAQTPTVESTDADFNTLGIQFRGYHDFGADKSEYLAGIKSKGAA